MSYQSVVNLNNEGVSFLVKGNDEMAIKAFSQSIKMVKAVLTERQEAQTYDNLNSPCSQAERLSSLVFSGTVLHTTRPLHIRSASSSGDNDETFIYANGIEINTTVLAEVSSMETIEYLLNLLSASAIFNLALLYHLRSRNGTSQSSLHLQKAQQMYNICIRLIQGNCSSPEQCSEAAAASCPTSMLLLLASMNNASQILLELGSDAAAKQMFHDMSCFIQNEYELLRPVVSNDAWSGFMSNVLLVHYTSTAAAAA